MSEQTLILPPSGLFKYEDWQRPRPDEIKQKQSLGYCMQRWELRLLWVYETRTELYTNRGQKECCWCHAPLAFDEATLDHLVPRSQHGKDTIENVAIACNRCNQCRGSSPVEEFRASAYLKYRRGEGTRPYSKGELKQLSRRSEKSLNFQIVFIKSSIFC